MTRQVTSTYTAFALPWGQRPSLIFLACHLQAVSLQFSKRQLLSLVIHFSIQAIQVNQEVSVWDEALAGWIALHQEEFDVVWP
jgi:hypothetical protein